MKKLERKNSIRKDIVNGYNAEIKEEEKHNKSKRESIKLAVSKQCDNTASDCSIIEGEADINLVLLRKLLDNRNLIKSTDIKLSGSIIIRSLRGLHAKNLIDLSIVRTGNQKKKTIVATIKGSNIDPFIAHCHNSSDQKWYEKPEIKKDFLNLVRRCDSEIKTMIENIDR